MPETSTSEIAARVFEDAGESIDSGNELTADNNGASDAGVAAADSGPVAPSGATEGQPGEPSAEHTDELLSELGLKPRTDGREHRIPYSRVQKIRENAIKKAQEAAKGEWEPKLTAAEQRARAIEESEAAFYDVVMRDEQRALEVLASVNPRFARFLQQQAAAGGGEQPGAGDEQFQMPEPDLRLQDGSTTYSVKGVQKAIVDAVEWATKRAEQRLGERYKPVEQTFQQLQEARRIQAINEQSEQRVNGIYADAQTWPGFKENEAEIQKAFNEDFKDLGVAEALNAAYRKVVVMGKMQTTHQKMREQIIAELNRQSRSTAAVPSQGQAAAPAPSGPRTTEQIAREVHRRLNQQA